MTPLFSLLFFLFSVSLWVIWIFCWLDIPGTYVYTCFLTMCQKINLPLNDISLLIIILQHLISTKLQKRSAEMINQRLIFSYCTYSRDARATLHSIKYNRNTLVLPFLFVIHTKAIYECPVFTNNKKNWVSRSITWLFFI